MTFKALLMRWFWSALGVAVLAFAFVAVVEQGNALAALTAPAYVPLSQEEVFKRAGMKCVHPPGAKTGCVYPELAEPKETGDLSRDYHNRKLADIRSLQLQFRLDEPERRNHEEYQEREIQPRHDRLTLGAGIFLGIAGLIIVLRALASTQRWWSARAPLDLSTGWRRFVPHGFGAGIRDTVASRKLRRIESDFQALKSLRDNGVISQEVFEQRMSALRDALATD